MSIAGMLVTFSIGSFLNHHIIFFRTPHHLLKGALTLIDLKHIRSTQIVKYSNSSAILAHFLPFPPIKVSGINAIGQGSCCFMKILTNQDSSTTKSLVAP